MDDITKKIAIKFVGSNRATETLVIAPGTTTREVLAELNLDPTAFQLSDARNLDIVYRPEDIIFARVNDGDLLYASAVVLAGMVG